jgi:hypothetical protein
VRNMGVSFKKAKGIVWRLWAPRNSAERRKKQ